MKKHISLILLLMVLSTMLFANGTTETTKSTTPTEKTVVRIWTKDRHDANLWTAKFKEYNETNTDNIEVKYEIYTDNFAQAVAMAFQTGEVPDLFEYDDINFNKYIYDGKLADLMPYLDADPNTKKLVEPAMYDGVNLLDGKLYYIPTGNTCLRLFYNKTIFDRLGLKVPTTLEEMVEDAKTITEKLGSEGIYGFACNLKSSTSGLKRSFEPEAELSTGLRLGYDFGKGEYNFLPYAPILEAWKEMLKYGFPGCESLDIDPLRSQFAAGKIGMYMSYTHAEPGVYANQFPMAAGQDWGCTYLPTPGGVVKGKQYCNVTPAYMFNADGKHKDAAWKAYKSVMLNPENLCEHFEQGLGISLLPEVLDKANMGQKYKDNPALLKSDNDIIWPLTPQEQYPNGMIVEGTSMYDTFASIIFGQTDTTKGLTDLTNRYNKALKQGIKDGECKQIINAKYAPKN